MDFRLVAKLASISQTQITGAIPEREGIRF